MLQRLCKERLLEASIWLPTPLETLFPFFADAANLNTLTPPWLNFEIVTPLPIEMKSGALIEYRIGLKGVPMKWLTRIAEWNPPHRFVDEQLKGPYLLWHHTHEFKREQRNSKDGTLCIDRVRYKHVGGPIVEKLIVRRDIDRIFAYRKEKMQELFGKE